MIIDSHTHIFPEQVKDDRSGFFKGEPEFRLLYDSPKAVIVSIRDLIETMDIHGIHMSVIGGFPWRNSEFSKRNNDYIIECVHKYPERIRGLSCFDAGWKGAADEALRCIDSGLSGVGELAFYLSGIDRSSLQVLEPVMEVLRSRGDLPCMIHTNEPVGHRYPGKTSVSLEQIYALARAFPDNKIILAHWGGGIFFYNIMKKEVKSVLKNIWYDTAASPFLYGPEIYDIAADAGMIDKILFGTDFPLLAPDRYFKDIESSKISHAQKLKILGENAALLFGQE